MLMISWFALMSGIAVAPPVAARRRDAATSVRLGLWGNRLAPPKVTS